MSIRSVLGIDTFELIIHVAVTGILLAWVNATNSGTDVAVFSSMIGIGSLVVLSVRRRLALRRGQTVGLTSGEMAAERLAELEQRMAELEAAQAQVSELAERLDFTERLLAQGGREQAQVGPGDRRV
jgi:cell shape-determining protein MreC